MRTTATEVEQHELVTSVCGHVSGPFLTSELSGNSTATDHWQMESVPPRPIHLNCSYDYPILFGVPNLVPRRSRCFPSCHGKLTMLSQCLRVFDTMDSTSIT